MNGSFDGNEGNGSFDVGYFKEPYCQLYYVQYQLPLCRGQVLETGVRDHKINRNFNIFTLPKVNHIKT